MLVAPAILLLLILLWALRPAGTPRVRLAAGTDRGKSLAVLEQLELGGTRQWVLLRSANVDHPVVLFLHGGPGTAQLAVNRRYTRDLEEHFIIANWDQRGAGKSYRAVPDAATLNIEQFVEDTRELTCHLLQRFHKRQIALVGHSWGTVIGALAVARYPELYSCYVGIGQMVNMRANEVASYEWTLEQAHHRRDRRAVTALENMGPPPYRGNWQAHTITQRSYLARYGGEVHGSRLGGLKLIMPGVLFAREYTLADRRNFFRGIFRSMRLLWPELLTVDLFARVPELRVPVFLIEGRHDHEAPSDLAAKYFQVLRAPSKELIWFERSAHMPHWEEPERFTEFMVTAVRPLCGQRATASVERVSDPSGPGPA
jgi:pimeloyl-ACP methyl ester carboxylesterase